MSLPEKTLHALCQGFEVIDSFFEAALRPVVPRQRGDNTNGNSAYRQRMRVPDATHQKQHMMLCASIVCNTSPSATSCNVITWT